MARFRGTVQGSRGEASRLGHRGIEAQANGWDAGVKVYGSPRDVDGRTFDEFQAIVTGGSNGSARDVEVFRLIDGNLYLSREAVAAAQASGRLY